MPRVSISLPDVCLSGSPTSASAVPLLTVPSVFVVMQAQATLHPDCAADSTPPPVAPPVSRRDDTWIFRPSGFGWQISMGDTAHAFRDKIGFYYLASLVLRPLEPVTAVDLQAAKHQQHARIYAGSLGPVQSTESLSALRSRAKDVMEDLEEARMTGSATLQERLQHELSSIAQAIRSGTALGGKTRDQRDSERVRIAVTKAIQRAIWSIRQRTPAMADYFDRTIVTGTWLRFHPLGAEVWREVA